MLNVLFLLLFFSSRDQVKKSVQQSMALPPAQPLVELWKYKEFSALGSNDVEHCSFSFSSSYLSFYTFKTIFGLGDSI